MTDDPHWKDGDLDATPLFRAAINEGDGVKARAGAKIEGFLDSLGVVWDLDEEGDIEIRLDHGTVFCFLMNGFVLFQGKPLWDVTDVKAKKLAEAYEGLLGWNSWPEPAYFAILETDTITVVLLRASISATGVSKSQLAWVLHSMEKLHLVWERDIEPTMV